MARKYRRAPPVPEAGIDAEWVADSCGAAINGAGGPGCTEICDDFGLSRLSIKREKLFKR
jgi:hypothetical protein